MYRVLHDELAWWTERYRNHSRLQRQRDAVAATLRCHEDALRRHVVQLERGRSALQRLERSRWSKMLAQLRGGWAESLDRGRQQTLAEERRVHSLGQAAAEVRAELDRLERELASLGDVGVGYRRALEAKARTLASTSDPHGRLVTELIDGLLRAQSKIRDLAEANASGRRAWESLDRLMRRVSAPGWSAARPRVGYEVVAKAAATAQDDLRLFLRALAALHELGPTHREAVMTFSDTFFERLIDRWVADPRSDGPTQAVRRVQQRVESILAQVDQGRQSVEHQQSSLWGRFVTAVHAG